MLPIRNVTIHCSANRVGRFVSVDELNRIAMRRFGRKSYHWIITSDGIASRNIPDHVKGAHVGGHNTGNIGIVYVGGLNAAGQPEDTRTAAQRETMAMLAREYRDKYPSARIIGHRDWSPDLDKDGRVEKHEWLKACPCFDVQQWLKEIGL